MKHSTIMVEVFKFLCIIATVIMVGYWIHKYRLNKDFTVVEYKPMEAVKDVIYPAPSICFDEPFIKGGTLKTLSKKQFKRFKGWYIRYLKGYVKHKTYPIDTRNISYNEVTPDLSEFILKLRILWKPHWENRSDDTCSDFERCKYFTYKNHYNGFTDRDFTKCFTIEIEPQYASNMIDFTVIFSPKLESVLKQVRHVYVGLFRPNQYLRQRGGVKLVLRNASLYKEGELFQMTSVEILRRRNKHNNRCLTDWKEYDEFVYKRYLESVGCRPPYLVRNEEVQFCNTSDDIKKAHFDGWNFVRKMKFLEPCEEMRFINYQHNFVERVKAAKGYSFNKIVGGDEISIFE